MARTIIISDLHIDKWHDRSREEAFSHFLSYVKANANRLIINGDILDFPPIDGEELSSRDKRILGELLTLPIFGVEVVYIPGNHDIALRGLPFSLQRIRLVYPRFVFQAGPKKVYVEHGHYYDPLFNGMYDILDGLKKMTGYDLGKIAVDWWKATTRFLQRAKREGKTNEVGVSDSVLFARWEAQAEQLHSKDGYDYVVFGHTHHPQSPSSSESYYINTGDWVDHSTVTEFDEQGCVRQFDWLAEGMRQAAPAR
ncbi:MAG: UDP-2,3-diacylglucosamine diphosphatase [Limnochordales bacterium]|nr:UDP-2,3-diacylglucosamine diphosphatase [Limnochordales bacterium]